MARKTVELKDLAANEQYAVQVRAVGENGITSNWSSTLRFNTGQKDIKPSPPTNLTVTTEGDSFILEWTAPTTNVDGSTLEDLSNYSITVTNLDDSTTAEYTSFSETFEFTRFMNIYAFGTTSSGLTGVELIAGNLQFDVRTRDLGGNVSDPATATTSVSPPGPFTLTNNEADAPLTVSLSWETPTGNVSVYEVVWGTSSGVYTNSSLTYDTNWEFSTLPRGTYYFKVRAYNMVGASSESNEVTADVIGFWESDFSVPDAPTISNITTPPADEVNGIATIEFDLTGPSTATPQGGGSIPYNFHNKYRVRWSTSPTGPWEYQTLDDSDNTSTYRVTIEDLVPGTLYYFEAASVSEYGQAGVYQTGSTTTEEDTTEPAAPTGLSATGSLKNITVSWDANTEADLDKYELYASQSSMTDPEVDGTKIYTGNGTGFAHGVADNATWYYAVRAVDRSQNPSAFSIETSATSTQAGGTGDGTPPSAVSITSLTSTTYYHGMSELAYAEVIWSGGTDSSYVNFVIAYSIDGGTTWTELVAGGTDNHYIIPDLQPGVEVSVKVKAVDAAGNDSGYSAVQTTTPTNTNGAVQEEVAITASGAIQSEVFTAPTEGFRLDKDSLEIYGNGTATGVSLIIGGSTGLNMNTATERLWFGASTWTDASWRVDGSGNMRVGSDTLDPEQNLYIDSVGNIWSGNDLMADAPWAIDNTGSARFDDVVITASGLADGSQALNIAGQFIVTKDTATTATVDMAGTMNITGSLNVNSGSITTTDGSIIVGSGPTDPGVIKSNNFVAGTSGYQLDANGLLQAVNADISGTLDVTGASTFGANVTVSSGFGISSSGGEWTISGDGSATFGAVSIDSAGQIDVGTKFTVSSDGTLNATGAQISGTLTSVDLYTATLHSGNISIGSSSGFHVDSSGNMWLGASTYASAPFRVSASGSMYAISGSFSASITGGTIDIGGADTSSFHVNSSGNMWLGDASYASAPFRVSSSGYLYAENGEFGGTLSTGISISSPSISGGTIIGSTLKTSGSGNYRIEIYETSSIGYIDFYSWDASAGTSKVAARMRGVTSGLYIEGVEFDDGIELNAGTITLDAGWNDISLFAADDIIMDSASTILIDASTEVIFNSNTNRMMRLTGNSSYSYWYGIDSNSYIRWDGDTNPGEFNVWVNGVQELRLANTSFLVPNVWYETAAASPVGVINSGGKLVQDTSTMRFKKEITAVNTSTGILNKVTPRKFKSLEGNMRKPETMTLSDNKRLGLIAEEVAQAIPEAAIYDDEGEVVNFDNRAVMAAMLLEIKENRDRIEELEAKLS